MQAARSVVDDALARGEEIYGVNVGVGSRASARVADPGFAQLVLPSHRVAQGPEAPDDVVRAAMLVFVNGLARGTTMARPQLAECFVAALNGGLRPRVRRLGSLGEADIAQMADLAAGVIGDLPLAPGEGLTLVSNNAFSTGMAALAIADAERFLEASTIAAAVDIEALQASLDMLDVAVVTERPFRGLRLACADLQELLAGSSLWTSRPSPGAHFHDPLSYRCTPQVHGAVRDALDYAAEQVGVEINAAQTNPLIDASTGRILRVGNFEALPLALALDFTRIALASLVTTAAERALKLLQPAYTGLSDGLAAPGAGAQDGLAEFDRAVYAIASEARLLAAPVSYEVAGTSISQGIEDRMNMAPLAARRLADMVELGERVVAIELVIAAQAIDLRAQIRLGRGSAGAYRLVRDAIPFSGPGEPIPSDLQPLCDRIRRGELAQAARLSPRWSRSVAPS
jgi:histidine ammonia-lyase